MQRLFSFFLCLLLMAMAALAQKTSHVIISGYVSDGFTEAGIPSTKVILLRPDSTVIDTCSAKIGGFRGRITPDALFQVKVPKSDAARLIIKTEHPQYSTKYTSIKLNHIARRSSLEIPEIYMYRKSTSSDFFLENVTVQATKVKVLQKGDTLVYNADAFNIPNGSMLDALIRQMPGTELKQDGEIFVNGKKIDYLLLNGEDFFRGKNKLMLENLPYYTVQNIKVYDKMPDKAVALHDDAAPKDYVMDVHLKKEYQIGYMANVEAGVGTHNTHLARLFGLRFSTRSRFSVIGNANNINKSGNANSTGDWARGYSDEGRTNANKFNAEWMLDRKSWKNSAQMELGHEKREIRQETLRELFQGKGNNAFTIAQDKSVNKDWIGEVVNKFTLSKPFWMEMNTKLSCKDTETSDEGKESTAGADIWHRDGEKLLDSLLLSETPIEKLLIRNMEKSAALQKAKSLALSQAFSFAKELVTGDVIETDVSVGYSKRRRATTSDRQYQFFAPLHEVIDKAERYEYEKGNFKTNAEVAYRLKNVLRSNFKLRLRHTYEQDWDEETITDRNSHVIDLENSYDYKSRDNVYSLGLDYSMVKAKSMKRILMINASIPVNIKNRQVDYRRFVLDSCFTQNYCHVEPSLMAELRMDQHRVTVQSDYSYTLPSVTQLISMPVTTDLINVYRGNPSLSPSSVLNATVTYHHSNKGEGYHGHTLSYSRHFNQITSTYSFFPSQGTYLFTPQNVNGTWNVSYESYFCRELFGRPNMRIEWDGILAYSEMVNYFSMGDQSQQDRSNHQLLNCRFPLKFVYYKGSSFFSAYCKLNWKKPCNHISDVGYSSALDYKVGLSVTTSILKIVDLESDFSFCDRTGYYNTQMNKAEWVWNFSLSRFLLKGKGVLKLTAIDLLHQRHSVAYTINNQGISELKRMVLPGYVMLSMQYKFNKNPKNKK